MRQKYKTLYKPNHPNSNKRGVILEHRYIMSLYLGRPLTRDEDVHHKNKNGLDNRIENLELITHSKHQTIHNPRIDRTNTFCNICKSKTTRKVSKCGTYYDDWYSDINGVLCENCHVMVKRLRKKFGLPMSRF